MRRLTLVIVFLFPILIAACGGEPTPDMTVVAQMAEEAVHATLTAQPTAISVPTNTPVPPTDTPQPTSTPTITPTDTPVPIKLSSVDIRGFLESVQPPTAYELGDEIEGQDTYADLPLADNEYIAQIFREGEEAGFVSTLLYEDSELLDQTVQSISSQYTSDELKGNFKFAEVNIDELGDTANGVQFSTQVDPIVADPVNFVFVELLFARCQGIVHIRLISPRQLKIYSNDKIQIATEDAISYAQRLHDELSLLICSAPVEND